MIWVVPVISIILSILIKITAKNSEITLDFIDFLDFGFALAVTSMTMILTNLRSDTGSWLLFIFFILVISTAAIVNRLCWDKTKKRVKILGVVIPDIVGITMLVVSIIYIGGGIN